MIYTVTCNPSLDYLVSVGDFRLGMTNRTDAERIVPGGKGINISIVLQSLGIESTALGFVAGFTGREIERRLDEMGIHHAFVRLKNGMSRINVKLTSVDGTEINGRGPEIGEGDMQTLLETLQEAKDGDILFLSGSVPASVGDGCYRRILEHLDGRGVRVIVDAAGKLLLETLAYRPFLIKPNHHELGELFGVEIRTRDEAIPYARRLREMGAQNVLVSMAGAGAVLISAEDQIYEAAAPQGLVVNSVGAGDAMAAGFVAGFMERRDWNHAFLTGVAAGSATAFAEAFASREEIEALYAAIRG